MFKYLLLLLLISCGGNHSATAPQIEDQPIEQVEPVYSANFEYVQESHGKHLYMVELLSSNDSYKLIVSQNGMTLRVVLNNSSGFFEVLDKTVTIELYDDLSETLLESKEVVLE